MTVRTDKFEVGDVVEFNDPNAYNVVMWFTAMLGEKPWIISEIQEVEPTSIEGVGHTQFVRVNGQNFSGFHFKPIIREEVRSDLYQVGDMVDLKPDAPHWLPEKFGARPWVVTDIFNLSAFDTQKTKHSQQLTINSYSGVSGAWFEPMIREEKPRTDLFQVGDEVEFIKPTAVSLKRWSDALGPKPWVVTKTIFNCDGESQWVIINHCDTFRGSWFKPIVRQQPSKEALLIEAIKGALNTEEDGDDLVAIALAAADSERELVSLRRRLQDLIDHY